MRWLALLLIAVLGACSRADFGAPVVHGDRGKTAAVRQSATGSGVRGEIVVRPGDSISKIAKEQGVELRDLIDANRLRSPYRIYPGQRLVLPRSATISVAQAGDPAANRYGAETRHAVGQNGSPPTYRPGVGQETAAPVIKTIAISPAEAELAASAAGKVGVAPAGPLPPGRVQSAALAPLPVAGSISGSIAEGMRSRNGADAAGSPPIAPSLAPEPVALAVEPKRSPVEIVATPPRGGQRFLWPVRGEIIVGFGPRDGGLQNDGINIRAGRGTTVKAAENGVVAYVGNELRGFGNLLLIKHADGWISAYAHNETLMVKVGDRVRRGQPISRVGSTGNVAQPQLHFELRRGSRAVDPLPYLTGGEV
jgi:murein DD-endopeptidase MepM/ murein hydrolase activator NlpD